MRRYLEARLRDRLWTELQHRTTLRDGGRFREAAIDRFFAFSVSQLMQAFVVLIEGSILSSVVFIAELIPNCTCKRRKKERIRALEE
jgi:hypothetical protein